MTVKTTEIEVLTLIPLTLIAVVYWVRDKYRYNRAGEKWYHITKPQTYVMFIYPIWIFFGWLLGLQTKRGQIVFAFVSTLGQNIVGYYTVIGVLNDSFRITKQQLVSFFLGLFIAFLSTTFWVILNIQTARPTCDCGDPSSNMYGRVYDVSNQTS